MVKNRIGDVAETKYEGLATTAGVRRRKRAAFGKCLHVLGRAHELRAPTSARFAASSGMFKLSKNSVYTIFDVVAVSGCALTRDNEGTMGRIAL